jgi:hypothetical protein
MSCTSRKPSSAVTPLFSCQLLVCPVFFEVVIFYCPPSSNLRAEPYIRPRIYEQ